MDRGGDPDERHARQREVLRQAGVALEDRVVALWEVSPRAEVVPVVTSIPDPPYHATTLDVDATLRRWGTPIIEGSQWVGCRLNEGQWCVAPVRSRPAAPPPEGVERRSRERITLELVGLCIGAFERPYAPRVPDAEALLELARHPSVVAHEVAGPLTAALASVENCLTAVREAEQLDAGFRARLLEELAAVADGTERAVEYLRSVQDRARGALARSERFDAVQVGRSCVTLERPLARRRGVTLRWDAAAAQAVYLQGDPNSLYRIVSNLIRNAVDASPRGETVAIGLERTNRGLRLTVRDRGAGIASQHIDRIFDPGFTTKPLGTGSGMGLTVVRDTAEREFGGGVAVESVVGSGTVVTVTLPLPRQRRPLETGSAGDASDA